MGNTEDTPPPEDSPEWAAWLKAQLPSPEEILKMCEVEAHNEAVKKKREAKLAARKARQAKKQKRRKRR